MTSDPKSFNILTYGDDTQADRRGQLIELMRSCPIPDDELLLNLGLFLTPQTLSRILFMDFLYRQILEVQGVIVEFGCRWGQNASLFTAMRGIYEPYNRLRKVVAFDTFAGFPGVDTKDGKDLKKGGYAVTPGYEDYLQKILTLQEGESPLAHIQKFEIVKGDASATVKDYLERNPETIIALAYFDMDIYEPTRDCLKAISGHVTRGSVIGFDEINDHACAGETVALKEVFGLDKYAVKRFPYNSRTSYLVIDH